LIFRRNESHLVAVYDFVFVFVYDFDAVSGAVYDSVSVSGIYECAVPFYTLDGEKS
jgi:hypothetical protein